MMTDGGDEPGSDGRQLSLRLDPERPALPVSLRPMLPQSTSTPFDDAEHLFEPWWGGIRAFAVIEFDLATGAATVRLIERAGRDLAPLLPELSGPGGLIGRVGGHSVVLDGSLVIVDARGRPDPSALDQRLEGRSSGPTVVFLAFDIVAQDGRPLVGEPLDRRRERLERIVEPGGPILVVPAIAGEGRALHAAAVAQGIPAIIGRHRRSPYLPGVRSRLWRLIPARSAASQGTQAQSAEGPPASEQVAAATERGEAGTAHDPAGPILALIQRLPLETDED